MKALKPMTAKYPPLTEGAIRGTLKAQSLSKFIPLAPPPISPMQKDFEVAAAEMYLRVWAKAGMPLKDVAHKMKRMPIEVQELVNRLQDVYAKIPGANFPRIITLLRFGRALGYNTKLYLEEC